MSDTARSPTTSRLVSQLTVDELRALWREDMRALLREERQSKRIATADDTNFRAPSLDDFPVDHFATWPEGMTFRREEMYDDGR